MYANRFRNRAAEEFGFHRLSRFQKIVGFGCWLLFVLLIVSYTLAVAGCASATSKAHAGQVASAGLSENLSTAHSEITAATPHCDATGKAHLTSADAAITSGKSKLPAIDKGLAQVAPLQAENAKLKSEFWSPRQRGLFLVVSLSIGGLLAALTVCYFLTPFGPVIGVIAASAFHVLSLGIPKFFAWIVYRIQNNVWAAKIKAELAGQKSAPLAVDPPNPPAPSPSPAINAAITAAATGAAIASSPSPANA